LDEEQFSGDVLGIETSCDETAAAIVRRTPDGAASIGSNIVLSQVREHAAFGGVVPEIAARAHLSALDHVIEAACRKAGIRLRDVAGIAATSGPGLIGGLLVGLMTAKALAAALGKPFVVVNHLEGHALTPRLTHGATFPYLLLLVSGGHTQILCVRGLGDYERWATTIDDAAGEAFDKTAKLLSLPFPGGPSVERAALSGDPKRFRMPRPLAGQATLNFSFSGLKTALREEAERNAPLSAGDVANLCASFQSAACDVLCDRSARAMAIFRQRHPDVPQPLFVAAGGVAANAFLRAGLEAACLAHGFGFAAPPLELCGDNAAMIAWAGLERLEAGYRSTFDEPARARWPLDESAPAVIGSGRKGAKA
jgi:N6-L-threonylcarbamoyladenine synthase